MTGTIRRVVSRAIATVAAAALIAAGTASPAVADSPVEPTVRVQIWQSRTAYHGPTTVRFFLNTDGAGHALVNETGYAAAAAHGLTRIDLLANGVLVGTTTEQPWSIDWDPGALPDAPVRLTNRSYDQAGRSFSMTFDSWVDHTAPTLRVHQNGYIRAGGEVYPEAADRYGITRVELVADGTVVDSNGAAATVLHWDRNAVDGPATLAVRARDTAGNVAEYRRTVLVDSVPPTFTITPASGAYVRGFVNVTAGGVRDASGFASLEVRFGGTWFAGEPATPKVAPVDTRWMADGRKVMECVAFDRAAL